MDIVPYLSAVVLVTTIATILLAVLSYAAFKLRDQRKPKASGPVIEPVYFHRFRFDDDEADDAEDRREDGAAGNATA